MKRTCLAAALAALTGCEGGAPPPVPGAPTGVVRVAPDGWSFERGGEPFVPAGVNYDHDAHQPCPRLLEEYWEGEWASVEADFAEMAALGFNVVRVHLQLGAFMDGPAQPSPRALERLDALVALARRHGLLLELTGLGLYRRERVPAWYLALDDEGAMAAEEAFWSAIARRYVGEPAIFAYELQNEPLVAAGETEEVVSQPFSLCDPDGGGPAPATGFSYVHFHFRRARARWTAWVQEKYGGEAALRAAWSDFPRAGESFTDIARPGFGSSAARVRDDLAFRHHAAHLWTARMAGAVRAADPTHLVTLGLTSESVPFQDDLALDAGEWLIYSAFSPWHLRDLLDFISMHVYPRQYGEQTNVLLSEMILRGAYVGRPVVLGETFPLVDDAAFDRFLAATRRSVSGWLSFYWGASADELRARGDLTSALQARWLDRYVQFVRRELPHPRPVRAAPARTVAASVSVLALDAAARRALYRAYADADARSEILDPVLAE